MSSISNGLELEVLPQDLPLHVEAQQSPPSYECLAVLKYGWHSPSPSGLLRQRLPYAPFAHVQVPFSLQVPPNAQGFAILSQRAQVKTESSGRAKSAPGNPD